MQINSSSTLLLLVLTSILSISVYSFCQGAVSSSRKTQHRKLNKFESLILVPFAAIYHLLIIKFLQDIVTLEKVHCFLSKLFEFSINQNSFADYLMGFYSKINSCVILAPSDFIIGIIGYYLIVVLFIPYIIGKILYRENWLESSYSLLVGATATCKFFLKIRPIKQITAITIFTLICFVIHYFAPTKTYLFAGYTVLIILILSTSSFFVVPVLLSSAFILILTWYLLELSLFIALLLICLPFYKPIKILKEWISTSDTPEYLKDYDDSDFFYIADATLIDGKMVTGILRDFDYRGGEKKLESIVLEKPVRWERFKKIETDKHILMKEISNEGYNVKEKLIPGESFYIGAHSIVDINTAKVPRNFIYIFSTTGNTVPADFSIKFKKWFKDNHRQKYFFSNIDIYIPAALTGNKQQVIDLFPNNKCMLGRIELFSVSNNGFMSFLTKTIFRKSKTKKLIIECDLDSKTITAPYFEKSDAALPILKQIILSIGPTQP